MIFHNLQIEPATYKGYFSIPTFRSYLQASLQLLISQKNSLGVLPEN
jgi:hypothetical protein